MTGVGREDDEVVALEENRVFAVPHHVDFAFRRAELADGEVAASRLAGVDKLLAVHAAVGFSELHEAAEEGGGPGRVTVDQEDVREVRTGFECGIGIEGFRDFQEGDVIEAYKREKVM